MNVTHPLLGGLSANAPLLALLTPTPLLLPLLVPRKLANGCAVTMGRSVSILSILSLLLGGLTCASLIVTGKPFHHAFLSWGPLGVAVYFDTVSAVMLLLVSFLAICVIFFSRNYLEGNPEQGRFFKWLSVTAGNVLLLVVSGNLALFAVAWAAVSLSLHKLLSFYGQRHGARLAARKKFVFSRLGDLCLIAAFWITWREFGTFDYAKLFASAQTDPTHQISEIALLLVAAAIIKSAQFPFHGWLPDTMETPTPVSALMHAGIINAGGFLIIRLSPLMVLSSGALELLAAVGGFTALFASLVMITQTSVKRGLAFSTVAQMGFMMLQCGLGAFALALLHIVAHSLYKAHSFLSSGSVIQEACRAGSPPQKSYPGLHGALAALGIALFLVFCLGSVFASQSWNDSGRAGLALILGISLAQMLWHWWSVAPTRHGYLVGLLAASLLCLFFFGLHAVTEHLIGESVAAPPTFTMAWPIAILTAVAFLILALRAFLPPTWASTSMGRALFVHAYNGFYVHTAANRLLSVIRPSRKES
jgi:NAD(P)H-quinone oxidoreductase subunit 5